jgi:hypothetical protein
MSDVNLASAPSEPSAPSQGEVPINPSPVSTPQPIGSQAPPAPVGDVEGKHHPQSRREATREAIRKAFERTSEPPKAAGSRMGHNQPPEPMAKERREPPKQPPLDLKRRPDDQRPRAEHGHFAARAADAASAPDRRPQAGPGPRQTGQPAPYNVVKLPAGAPYAESPTRWDARARAEWGAAPESVRASVHRMHQEFSRAYQRMHGDHQEMNRIRHFQQMAQQHGTTLERALHNYTSMEDKLRSDPVGGLDVIVNNLNLRTPEGRRITLADIAWHVLNTSPDQHRTMQMGNAQTALGQQLIATQQQLAALAQQQRQMQYRQAFARTRRGVDRFAETHPRLDELGALIQQEVRLGFDLPTAYRRAELLRPATHAAQTRTATAQTRPIDRSISGAPESSNGAARRRPSPGRREAIANAIRRANGSL